MTTSADVIDPQRFVLELLSDGGILLDLQSGLIYQLNGTAAFIWKRALRGDTVAKMGRALSETFGPADGDARHDVERALALPDSYPSRELTPYRYEAVGETYIFSDNEAAVFEIAPSDGRLRTLRVFDAVNLRLHVSAVTTKVASLVGLSVMHASAVIGPRGRVTLFTGVSGAGKTTTARALVKANRGWRLLSEDKVVLRPDREGVAAVLDGERRIAAWTREATERLGGGAGTECDVEPLRTAAAGAAFAVERVVLVDAARRGAGPLSLASLGQTSAAREIFQAGFYGSGATDSWRRQLEIAATLARTARTFEATIPHGLEALEQMARDYADTTTS